MSTSPNINDLLKNPDQIKQIISLLSTLLDASTQSTQSDTTEESQSSEETSTTTNIKTKTKTRETIKENKFASMPEANMHKEDPDLAKKLYRQPPTSRSRPNKTVEARCRVCGRKEKVQSSLLYGGIDRFKCNKCSTTPG